MRLNAALSLLETPMRILRKMKTKTYQSLISTSKLIFFMLAVCLCKSWLHVDKKEKKQICPYQVHLGSVSHQY